MRLNAVAPGGTGLQPDLNWEVAYRDKRTTVDRSHTFLLCSIDRMNAQPEFAQDQCGLGPWLQHTFGNGRDRSPAVYYAYPEVPRHFPPGTWPRAISPGEKVAAEL